MIRLATTLTLLLTASFAFGVEYDKRAKALAGKLKPSGLSKDVKSDDKAAAEAQMVSILNALEESARSQGPQPGSLLPKAFEFVKGVGKAQEIFSTTSLLRAWRDARQLGLFDDKGHFGHFIEKGRDQGRQVVFEYIVPNDRAPYFSRHYGNLRLVGPSQARDNGEKLNQMDEAFINTLVTVYREVENEKKLAAIEAKQKKPIMAEYDRQEQATAQLYETEVAKAGEDFHKLPNIKLRARVMGTPSQINGDRWRIEVDITNFSPHPTEFELRSHLLGMTYRKREHYVMAEKRETIKLMRGSNTKVTLYTKGRGSYKAKADEVDELSKEEAQRSKVRYLGFVIEANHAKGRAGSTASTRALETNYLDENRVALPALPRF
ncbi:MAG: hypothetical protein AAF585_25320 [Verrucomicrobiota bacterium]